MKLKLPLLSYSTIKKRVLNNRRKQVKKKITYIVNEMYNHKRYTIKTNIYTMFSLKCYKTIFIEISNLCASFATVQLSFQYIIPEGQDKRKRRNERPEKIICSKPDPCNLYSRCLIYLKKIR